MPAKDPIKRRATQKKYRAAHPEIQRAKRRRHYLKHQDELKAKMRKYGAEHSEQRKPGRRKYYLENQEHLKKRARERHHANYGRVLNRRYGTGAAVHYSAQMQNQSGKCATCGNIPTRKGKRWRLAQDHHESTKQLRGLLCSSCNQALGLCKENSALLRRLADYLEAWERARLGACGPQPIVAAMDYADPDELHII